MKLTIKVTAKDIKGGVRFSPWSCPVAQAAKRADPGFSSCDANWLEWLGVNIILPEKVHDWVKNFDRGYPVKPITFKVEVP